MYLPLHFKMEELGPIHAAMRASRLATLVTATADGLIGTPLPLILSEDEGDYGTLYGHVARPNPQWKLPAVGEAMAIFMGPDAYVTPSWYVTKAEHGKVVPTWNYSVVQLYGVPTVTDDPAWLRRLLNIRFWRSNQDDGHRATSSDQCAAEPDASRHHPSRIPRTSHSPDAAMHDGRVTRG